MASTTGVVRLGAHLRRTRRYGTIHTTVFMVDGFRRLPPATGRMHERRTTLDSWQLNGYRGTTTVVPMGRNGNRFHGRSGSESARRVLACPWGVTSTTAGVRTFPSAQPSRGRAEAKDVSRFGEPRRAQLPDIKDRFSEPSVEDCRKGPIAAATR